MEIKIFDVEHGFCSYIKEMVRTTISRSDFKTILIDCGYNSTSGFRPSSYLKNDGCNRIDQLIISNYDEDHLNDLPNINIPISFLASNNTLGINELKSIKTADGNSIGNGMKALIEIKSNLIPTSNLPDLGDIRLTFFRNRYADFKNKDIKSLTNNISLVTFLDYFNTHIIFPGDLQNSGWISLLQNISFKKRLQQVNIFVASHHGRENGYCPDVFRYCNPEIIIISDTNKTFATQNVDYSRHASGRYINGNLRKVLTTRNDGMITINQNSFESDYRVSTYQSTYWNYY